MTFSSSTILILVFIATTLPMVVTIFGALLPQARTRSLEDYFLYGRNLDLDSFLKTTVGYSLQAASVYLLFYWGFSYGLWVMVVPLSWGAGYWLLGKMLVNGRFDLFLKNQTDEETIHGHIWGNIKNPNRALSKWAVGLISATTVIGLGGSLLTEADYGSKFFLAATNLTSVIDSWQIQLIFVAFVAFYVLWGGYRTVVVTDRIHIPMAYMSFGVFAISLCLLKSSSNLGLVVAPTLALLFASFLWGRLNVLPHDDVHNRSVAWLTFAPLIIFSFATSCYLWVRIGADFDTSQLGAVLNPATPYAMGFGFLGVIALVLANAIWQFIDISSLQRLKSLQFKNEDKATIAKAMNTTGWEVAGGWLVILCAAFALKALGVSSVDGVVPYLLGLSDNFSLLLPIFIFAVVVFILSTISDFISAISYVAYYDLLKLIGLKPATASSLLVKNNSLNGARLTTLLIVSVLYVGYQFLIYILTNAHDANQSVDIISQAIYAVYAFQLSITPTVWFVIFLQKNTTHKLNPLPVLTSTTTGLVLAWYTATAAHPWFGISPDSWYVIPPLFVLFGGSVVFWLTHKINQFSERWFESQRVF
jgi:hypothetical protein